MLKGALLPAVIGPKFPAVTPLPESLLSVIFAPPTVVWIAPRIAGPPALLFAIHYCPVVASDHCCNC
jgi:hypothetical protein